jgi:hypothetical protein
VSEPPVVGATGQTINLTYFAFGTGDDNMPELMTPVAPELGRLRTGHRLALLTPATLPASAAPAVRRPGQSLVGGVCRALLATALCAVGLGFVFFGLVPVLLIALALFLPALLPVILVGLTLLATEGGGTATEATAGEMPFQI